MSKYPVIKAAEIIQVLNLVGFYKVRQRGSHAHYQKSDGRNTTVPVDKNKDISPILLRKIFGDTDTDMEVI